MRFHRRSVASSDSEDEAEPWGSTRSYTVSLDARRWQLPGRYRVDFQDEEKYEAAYGEDAADAGPSLLRVIIVCPDEDEDVWLTTLYDHVSRVQFILFPESDETNYYYLRLWRLENGTEEQVNRRGVLASAFAGNPVSAAVTRRPRARPQSAPA